ncbi:MAG: patatin-like phospholipase family protein [Polyangiales bacterium]
MSRPTIGLVLSGGGARGAYEAGVLRYLCEDFPQETGIEPWFDIVCGTSVGALNACFVAATGDVLAQSTKLLWDRWLELRADDLLRVRPMEILRLARNVFGGGPVPLEPPGATGTGARRGGLIDTSELERFVLESVPWSRITRNLDEGVVQAVSVSATHVASGKTVVFIDKRGELPQWSRDPWVRPVKARVSPFHALASAAIPLLFPPMPIDGAYYVDGGLRQNTPISPAVRLGADRVLVVSMRYKGPQVESSLVPEEAVPSPFFLAGKTLNALLIDRVDYDLDRLRRNNRLIEAGRSIFGEDFLARMNEKLAITEAAPLREVRDLLVRPSQDLGALAADFVASDELRSESGFSARLFRRLAARDPQDEADLLSYLLFEGGFARALLELGRRDARARRDELAAFFSP